MKHGLVEVFAYQETLLIMAVFGIAILVMIWVGLQRWLRSKGRMDRMLGEQAAEQTAHFGALVERVEERLNVIEQMLAHGGDQAATEIDASPGSAPEPISKPDPLRPDP